LARINDHYRKLAAGYLFPEIERRVREFGERNPGAKLIRLGIGDVVLPLPGAVLDAMHGAVDEMGTEEGFRGYGPDQGYPFLREAIAEGDFRTRGVGVPIDEIFVSDGSKCDSANIQEIFSLHARIAVPDPVYPVYVDTNVMAGRTGSSDADGRYEGIVYLPCTESNGFCPEPPDEPVDLVYLCFPNNPTGAATRRTRRTSRKKGSRTRSSRSKERARWRSSSGASRRAPGSPESAAPTSWSRATSVDSARTEGAYRSTTSGPGDTRRSSTASPTPSRPGQRRPTPSGGVPRFESGSTTTWATRRSSAKDWPRSASRSSAA
jgi:hypothetical protein